MFKKRLLSSLFFTVSLFSVFALSAKESTYLKQTEVNGVWNANSPPVFTSSAPEGAIYYGESFSYNFTAIDAESDPISFYVLGNEQLDANYQDGFYWATGGGTSRWQSFTAVSDGLLTNAGILMSNLNGDEVTFNIYSGEGTNGTLLYSTSLIIYNVLDYHNIPIPENANVILSSGQVYTIEYYSASSGVNAYLTEFLYSNPYAGGRAEWSSDSDYPFIVKIKPLTTSPVNSWLNLTDHADGTGSLSGTPMASNAGTFSETIFAKAGGVYVSQQVSLTAAASQITPTGLFSIAGNSQIELKWNQNPSNNFSKYYIYSGDSADPTTLIDSTISVSDTTKIISELSNGILYYFRIKAVDSFGIETDYSNEDAAVPVDGAGEALDFNGSNQFATVAGLSSQLIGSSGMTIAGWIFPRNTNPNYPDFDHFFGFRNDDDFSFYITQLTATHIEARLGMGGNMIDINSEDLTVNQWQFLALVYDGNSLKLYKNGNLIGTESISGTLTNGNSNFGIGAPVEGYYQNFNANAVIDEVQVWNVARTEEQINSNMFTPLTGTEDGLIGLWHFDESSGNIAYDASPFGNNAIIFNLPSFIASGALSESSLPVELISFSYNGNMLKWSTATESNNSGWEIEKREQNHSWKKIGFVSGKGTTTEKQNYSFRVSASSENKMEFRLKQIDSDGKVSFSNILSVDLTPSDFELSQNYPNPFNPSTIINFQLPVSGKVELKVFDLLGREVKILVNEEKSAGNYSVDFSAKDFPSGVYYYRLSSGNFSETKKMILMK